MPQTIARRTRQSAVYTQNPEAITNCFKLHTELQDLKSHYGITSRRGKLLLSPSLKDNQKIQLNFIKDINLIKQRWETGRKIVIENNLGGRWNYKENPVRQYSNTFNQIVNTMENLVKLGSKIDPQLKLNLSTPLQPLTKKSSLTPEDYKRLMAKLSMVELVCYVRGVIKDLHYSQIPNQ